jgi:four helix bundle protein
MKATGNLILDSSFQFALNIISFTDQLDEKRKYTIARQLLKSGTSIGANVNEAQAPESKNDFIHKMKISAKEAAETQYWLLLCKYSENLPDPGHLLDDVVSIQKILGKIIATSKSRY